MLSGHELLNSEQLTVENLKGEFLRETMKTNHVYEYAFSYRTV